MIGNPFTILAIPPLTLIPCLRSVSIQLIELTQRKYIPYIMHSENRAQFYGVNIFGVTQTHRREIETVRVRMRVERVWNAQAVFLFLCLKLKPQQIAFAQIALLNPFMSFNHFRCKQNVMLSVCNV